MKLINEIIVVGVVGLKGENVLSLSVCLCDMAYCVCNKERQRHPSLANSDVIPIGKYYLSR